MMMKTRRRLLPRNLPRNSETTEIMTVTMKMENTSAAFKETNTNKHDKYERSTISTLNDL